MCMTVHHLDLGPADALIDHAESRLVLRPGLTVADKTHAARLILGQAGVDQPTAGVTCICGAALDPNHADELVPV